ncbi:hypothetical protein B0T19DRAFT_26743 [Cercophora scortea]|uniref:Signal peptide-containing protein n=1 Tax=Cercophora scortea TaxID=314031 RepID=A0AAE0MLF7_9PEZI|nr:hypothetical protein B0T19DRAFT_26743 [Cercophora scortea]
MSFPVAVQSAIFYIVACTPCTKLRHRQRTKQTAKKEREEKARIVAEQPHLYQHPDPFSTNPYWNEEIRMGPSLPKKGKGGDSKNASQRGLTAVSHDGAASIPNTSNQAISTPAPEKVSTGTREAASSPVNTAEGGERTPAAPEDDVASPTLSKTASVSTADDWNLKRYQREDEELWGPDFLSTGHKLMDAIKQAGTTAGRFVESKLGLEKEVTPEDRHKFYFAPRNPPVNDYHPPVVSSKPAHKDALRWMLQPPPPAKVMEGKVPVSRTGSMMSVGSRRTVGTSDGMSLGRQVSERAFEARLRRGETPFEGDFQSTASLNRMAPKRTGTASTARTARTKSRRTTRSRSISTTSTDSIDGTPVQRRRRPSYRNDIVADVESEDEDEYISRSLESLSNTTLPTHAAQRPRLSTILSSNTSEKTGSSRTDRRVTARPPSLQEVPTLDSVSESSDKKTLTAEHAKSSPALLA